MRRTLRSFLTNWQPVRDIVREQVGLAVDEVARLLDKERTLRREQLREADLELTRLTTSAKALRMDVKKLRAEKLEASRAVNSLTAERNDYHEKLLEAKRQNGHFANSVEVLRRRIKNLEAMVRELQAAPTEPVVGTSDCFAEEEDAAEGDAWQSDLFGCMKCSTLWLLSWRPTGSPAVNLMRGCGCQQCEVFENPEHLLAIRQNFAHQKASRYVAQPIGQGDQVQQSGTAVKFVVDVLSVGVITACANTGARTLREFVFGDKPQDVETDRGALDLMADGLDKIPAIFANGVAWLATGLFGVPSFFSAVLGNCIAKVVLAPLHLHQMAQFFRVVDILVGDQDSGSLDSLLEDVAKIAIKNDLTIRDPSALPNSLDSREEVGKTLESPRFTESPSNSGITSPEPVDNLPGRDDELDLRNKVTRPNDPDIKGPSAGFGW